MSGHVQLRQLFLISHRDQKSQVIITSDFVLLAMLDGLKHKISEEIFNFLIDELDAENFPKERKNGVHDEHENHDG